MRYLISDTQTVKAITSMIQITSLRHFHLRETNRLRPIPAHQIQEFGKKRPRRFQFLNHVSVARQCNRLCQPSLSEATHFQDRPPPAPE